MSLIERAGAKGRRERKNYFGRHDRLVIDGQSFCVDGKHKDTHFLRQVTDGLIVEDRCIEKTDQEINALEAANRFRHDEGFYSKTLSLLRVRHDNSDLTDLSEVALRTVAWKKEWCVRFLRKAGNTDAPWRPKHTLDDMEVFIEAEKDLMDRWYLDLYGERRAPGRKLKGQIRKAFDYPSASGLRKWLNLYLGADCRMEAFRPRYENCGNRNQLDPRAVPVITSVLQSHSQERNAKICDIFQDVEGELEKLNVGMPAGLKIRVSERAVRRRVHQIDPFIRVARRRGPDYALRMFTPVGKGLQVSGTFERIEIDDWEADLHTLVTRSNTWVRLPAKLKAKIPRVRCTLTVAIDCATRCIVGLNVTLNSPSTATAKSTLRSAMVDKTPLARWAGAKGDWDIFSRPGFVATDGGPAFRGGFEEAVRLCRTNRTLPDQDPRMRGTIEAFFRTLKRLCRYFAGQAFKDVVEKGDYPAEQMASLTYENFYRAVVRYIVDYYHHRKHRGLEGCTPYGTWLRLSEPGLPPPLSQQQIKVAFGFKEHGTIDKHGLQFLAFSYHSNQLGQLHRLVGNQKVEMTIDPDNLGSILVRIPRRHKGRIEGIPPDWDYLEVPCVEGIGNGVTLVQVLEAKEEVKAIARKQQEEGKALRLSAHQDLLAIAEEARKAAGLPSSELTQKQFSLLTLAIAQKQRAALTTIEYGPAGRAAADQRPGEVVAKARRTKVVREPTESDPRASSPPTPGPPSEPAANPPAKPFGGGMNLYGEDK